MDPEKKDTSDSETTSVNEIELDKDVENDAGVTEKDRPKQPTRRSRKLEFDQGEEQHVLFRRKWWQLWLPKDPPPPAPKSLDDAKLVPVANASFISVLTYTWINPLMVLGYQRTLQATDLWKLDESREAGTLGAQFDVAWAARVQAAAEWNARLAAGEVQPSLWLRFKWFFIALVHLMSFRETRRELETSWREGGGRREASIAWALNDVFGWTFWTGGIFKVFGDTSQLMGPLLVRTIITFSEARVAAQKAGEPTAGIGRGVGMAIGLFCLTVTASVCTHQFFWRSMVTGMLARAALISSIYKRGIALTGKARTALPNSKLVTHISTDVSRVDACAQWFHATWTAPIQVTICLIILLVQLGPSALAGFSLFLLIMPIQERVMSLQFSIGKKTLKWTDKRSKLILEVLGAMRVVKYFSHEQSFLRRLYDMRYNELRGIRKIQIARSANIASAFSVPVLAATLSFVVYTSTNHAFNVATIFSSLSLFNLLRQPLMFLPRALSATTDAQNALERLKTLFLAELSEGDAFIVDKEQNVGLLVEDATFEWEESPSTREETETDEGKKGGKEAVKGDATPTPEQSAPFQVKDVTLSIPRGTLAAVVGSVGSGKSSLLQGLIGEMRKVHGHVSFGGKVAYCSQTAWIQNASLKENVLFGQSYDEERYWKAIECASLLPDLEVLPDGDLTEIGEKGINLSGGQKQRVNIARALYYDADIVIFDDPLSAVDAHVGKALFANAIIGALRDRGKTVILVTHALHFLDQCDYIYTMKNGRIEEQGTYVELMQNEKVFSRLIKEFGGTATKEEDEDIEEQAIEAPQGKPVKVVDEAKIRADSARRAAAGSGKLEGRLIIPEKRTTGSVGWSIYGEYLKAGRGWITGPIVLCFILLMQGCTIMNSYTLIWWEEDEWGKANSFYQVLYACLGIGQAIFTFAVGGTMDELGFYVSSNLHHDAIRNIFYAPMSYFDTTPLGRILSIFGKDIENIDNQLPVSMRLFILTISNMIGSVTIITVLEHYFIIAVVGIAFGYNYFASFYRASARELKRIDAMLRSLLYAHFAESLSGLPTIRSYGETNRFLKDNEYYVDLEDRAAILTVTNQRWLAIRLDFLGGMLIFIVAMLAVSNVSGINSAQIGLVLTYSTALVQMCSMVTRQSAEVETYMSSVERVVEYSRADRIEQEAPHEIKDHKPPEEWPSRGAIEFNDVVMRYRPGLPFVLKGLSLSIRGGEKIGVVGRTGAGKSSLMLALFRIVELSSGSICIDGIDISTIGLKDLRSKLSIIPQDPLLFSGTIRSNLDPFDQYTDAHLWDALRRSYLIDNPVNKGIDYSDGTDTATSRFNLDTVIESEGANLSVGERSLLSLARALVKDSQVVVLDEATASVDLETDSKIQQTIQTQFGHKTLLCIAHRLRTIISYDRILVMDAGQIAEFDTPLNLFHVQDGIFRGMCERSGITTAEIEKATLKVHLQ